MIRYRWTPARLAKHGQKLLLDDPDLLQEDLEPQLLAIADKVGLSRKAAIEATQKAVDSANEIEEREAKSPVSKPNAGTERPKPLRIKSPKVAPAKKINGNSHFKFEWQRAFCAVDDISLDTGLTPTTRLVLWTVSKHMNADGTGAYPGQERIAKEAGLSLRTTKLHLALAAELGWLSRELNHKSKYGTGYVYTAKLPSEGDSTKPGFVVSRIRNARKGGS